MVTRLLKYEATVDADATDATLDTKSPGSNKRWEVQEVYGTGDANHSFSISYEERKLMDNVQGDRFPTQSDGLPFDVTIGESEDLAILATDENSSQDTARFYVRVAETSG